MGSAAVPTTLKCGIVGAGIAGLGAALSLRQAGHDVEVFEKSSLKREIGAAITLTPNANLILDRWGFDSKRARETPKEQYRMVDCETLECLQHQDFDGVREQFGHAFNAYHRVDMHEHLRAMAEGAGAAIRLGCPVTDVDCEKGTIHFQDGSTVVKDLVVIADGVKSTFVDLVAGEHVPMEKTGLSVYRTLISIEKLMNDPLVRPIFDNQKSGFCMFINKQNSVFFVTYPCRDVCISGEASIIAVRNAEQAC